MVTLSLRMLEDRTVLAAAPQQAAEGSVQLSKPWQYLMRRWLEPMSPDLILGGPAGARVILRCNIPLIRRALLTPDDLLEASLSLKVVHVTGEMAGTRLTCYRLLKPITADTLEIGEGDYDAIPLVSYPLETVYQDGKLIIPGFAPAIKRWLRGEWPEHGLLVALTSPETAPLVQLASTRYADKDAAPSLMVTMPSHPKAQLFPSRVVPRSGMYVRAEAGHLYYGSDRLRLWGVCRHAADPSAAVRLKHMGFNAIRLWGPQGIQISRTGEPVIWDPAQVDEFDRFFAACKQEGLFIMCPSLFYVGVDWSELLRDDSFVAGGPDWEEWKAAVLDALARKDGTQKYWIYFDARIQRIMRQKAAAFLNHVNPYTGKRYAEEEAIAIFELQNENGMLKWVLERGFDDWTPFFRKQVQQQWNAWLRKRYGDDAGLRKAWGNLDVGETLATNAVQLKPIFPERNIYPKQRGDDFVRFMIETVDQYNTEMVAFCRTLAPKGVGVNVIPFLYDTQFRPNIPWLYANSRADVLSFGIYEHTLTSALTVPPSMYVLDSLHVADKPVVLYEVNTDRPNPYRTEFPLRVATLAGWQDWDGVFWHYWQDAGHAAEEQFLIEPLPIMKKGWADGGFCHATDPVMCSALAAAGQLFLSGAITPASRPATYEVGSQTIFSYDYFNGLSQRQVVFSHGSRIRFVPDCATAIAGDGPAADGTRTTAAVAGGEQILWDWPNGRLIVDTPTLKAYVGRKVEDVYRFRDGIMVGGFRTPFVSFVMQSTDGRPLVGAQATQRILLTAVFDARNTGFEMDWSIAIPGGGFIHPDEQAAAVRNPGCAPVIVEPVPYTVWFPIKLDYRFEGYDFALRRCLTRDVRDSNVLIHDGRELFMGVLQVARRDGPTPVPEVKPASAGWTQSPGMTAGATDAQSAVISAWNPIAIPGFSWETPYPLAYQCLRDSALTFSSISPYDETATPVKRIILSEVKALFNAPANIEVVFGEQGEMIQMSVTFLQPPVFETVVAEYERQFGKPVEKQIVTDAFKTSRVRWVIVYPAADLEIVVTEFQGFMGITYRLDRK